MIASLSRADLNTISYEMVTGDAPGGRGPQSPDQTLHSVRMWKAALKQKFGSDAEDSERKHG